MTPELNQSAQNAQDLLDRTFDALTRPTAINEVRKLDDKHWAWTADERQKWGPLEILVGAAALDNFMYMGEVGDLALYKHVLNRRYLNIDRKTGQTYKHTAGVIPSGYEPISHDEALAHVHEGAR